MAVTAYKYQSPLDKGYIRVKMTRAQHKEIFRVRKIPVWRTAVYYYNGEKVIVEHLTARWFVLLMAIPLLLIGPLFQGIPQTWKDLTRELFPHKYGSFSGDSWLVSADKHEAYEQPIIDAWMEAKPRRITTDQ